MPFLLALAYANNNTGAFIATLLLLAWGSGSKRLLKICLINLAIIIIYNLAGWGYIFRFLSEGEASLGPGLILIGVTAVHVGILFITAVVLAIKNSVKEQSR